MSDGDRWEPVWDFSGARENPELWDRFVAFGEVVDAHLKMEGRRRLRGMLLLDRLEEVEPEPEESGSKVAEEEGPEDLRYEGRMQRERREGAVMLNRALEGLSGEFPFLEGEEGQPPVIGRILLAMLQAQYVLRGEMEVFDDLRKVLMVLEPRPSGWAPLLGELEEYLEREDALLAVIRNRLNTSLLDAGLGFSRRAIHEMLGSRDPKAEPPRWKQRERLKRFRAMMRRRGAGWDPEEDAGTESVSLRKPGHTLRELFLPEEAMGELRFARDLAARSEEDPPVFLFHGPPGTGKTHAALALAGSLKRPAAVTELPRIMDKFFGETEKLIAKAFEEAREHEAVLVLDEADALVFSRVGAQRSWEVSHVNTLLKLLERPGVPVVLCTNLLPTMDDALLRRVHHLVEFEVPDEGLRAAIWRWELKKAGLSARRDLGALAAVRLTGGLIANAVRQASNRKKVGGPGFRVTARLLLDLAQKELPKMGDMLEGAGRIAGFGGR